MEPKSHNKRKNNSQKHTSGKHVENTSKSLKKVTKRHPFGNFFRPKRPLNQKGSHSLKPTFGVGKTKARVGEREQKRLQHTSPGIQFFAPRESIEKVSKKFPKVFPRGSKWSQQITKVSLKISPKNTSENMSKILQKTLSQR